ncbi:hypothetical protein EON65_16395 [archaeon]|nr:MAG: hypothetical protein EON65_16395 [archaeon]
MPTDSPTSVKVARLSAEFFDHWESFRNLLLVKTVPLIQKLPRKERSQILQHLQVREFKDGDYIIKQGEKGASTVLLHIYTEITLLIVCILPHLFIRRGFLHYPGGLREGGGDPSLS